MSFLDRFKKKKDDDQAPAAPVLKSEKALDKVKAEPVVKEDKPKLIPRQEKVVPKPSKDDTGNAHKVLMHPLLTEKITDLGALNKYAFAVAVDATKNEVKKAIRSLYGVEPVAVNMINLRGRDVRYGRSQGRTKSWKKAIITLKHGETIQVYEGV